MASFGLSGSRCDAVLIFFTRGVPTRRRVEISAYQRRTNYPRQNAHVGRQQRSCHDVTTVTTLGASRLVLRVYHNHGGRRWESKELCKPYARIRSCHQMLLRHHEQLFLTRSRLQVSCVQQELPRSLNQRSTNNIQNRTRIQSSLLDPSFLPTLRRRVVGQDLAHILPHRVA